MALYQVFLARAAQKELENLDPALIKRIIPRIEKLSVNPRPSGCLKLQGAQDLWRIRVGDYRIIYTISDESRIVEIMFIRHRKDVYR